MYVSQAQDRQIEEVKFLYEEISLYIIEKDK
jgi:hypothetical protein